MPIDVKANISKAKDATTKVSAVDSETLIAALDKSGPWGKYQPNLSMKLKVSKDKKVTEVVLKAKPVATVPSWVEYSKTTKARQAEWDKMIPKLRKYLASHHALFLEAVAKFAAEVKPLDLDKSAFDKLWKTKKAHFTKVLDDYASKTSDGYSVGVKLEVIGPDPVEGESDIKAPKTKKYSVSGKTIEAVFDALEKRDSWGRYRSKHSCSLKYAIDGKLSKITVKAAPIVTMPKWAQYNKGNTAQKATWDDMWATLNTHEFRHHKIFTDAVAAFLTDIEGMDLDKAAVAKHWKKSNDAWQALQDGYDSRSGNGVKEGVSLDFNADP